jgi:hypothetical protein
MLNSGFYFAADELRRSAENSLTNSITIRFTHEEIRSTAIPNTIVMCHQRFRRDSAFGGSISRKLPPNIPSASEEDFN